MYSVIVPFILCFLIMLYFVYYFYVKYALIYYMKYCLMTEANIALFI
jgi:hypothetical protein